MATLTKVTMPQTSTIGFYPTEQLTRLGSELFHRFIVRL